MSDQLNYGAGARGVGGGARWENESRKVILESREEVMGEVSFIYSLDLIVFN